MNKKFAKVHTLTFDLFGTVLDLTGGLVPSLREYFRQEKLTVDAGQFWKDWRARQRIEQYQDTLLRLGHHGYLETALRALFFTCKRYKIPAESEKLKPLVNCFGNLSVFEDAQLGLCRLSQKFRLVALSNGDQWLVDRFVRHKLPGGFERSLSVDSVGHFKPHPSVYRMAVKELDCNPEEIMMVAAHSFDVFGAQACGFQGAYVNRYQLPFEEPLQVKTDRLVPAQGWMESELALGACVCPEGPDIVVNDFEELANILLDSE